MDHKRVTKEALKSLEAFRKRLNILSGHREGQSKKLNDDRFLYGMSVGLNDAAMALQSVIAKVKEDFERELSMITENECKYAYRSDPEPAGDPTKVVIPFGKYAGKTVAEVGSTATGIRYLEFLRKKMDIYKKPWTTISKYILENKSRLERADIVYGFMSRERNNRKLRVKK